VTRSILITGCSSGIGYDCAQAFRARGWRVFASCRKIEDCERLRAEGFESPRIDYADPAAIVEGLTEVLEATGGTLDVLYNNAAYGLPALVEDVPREAMEEIFHANFFGVHDLTRRVVPVMRAQGHGRIINCSSVLGLVSVPWRGPYASTKFALEALTDALRMELRGTGIRVVLIEPGPIGTKFRVNTIPPYEKWIRPDQSARAGEYRTKIEERMYRQSGRDPFERPASAVTRQVLRAVEARNPRARYFVTLPTHVMAALVRLLPTRAMDWLVSRR
jgi:NAD(P)-dependent dehydrogenase (short-subunit alcohol dehydrogenase family)